jgi:hypothetical protein
VILAPSDAALGQAVVANPRVGVTAAWGARRYAAWFTRAAAVDPQIPEAAELPDRLVQRRSRRR